MTDAAEPGVTLRPPPGPLRVLDDLWNPVLVKEVRQAVRGRTFRVSFLCTLVAVSLVATGLIMDMHGSPSDAEGRSYFVGVYVCLSVAAMGLVPFMAFTSMGSEWDENTWDLLVISNLRPRQIVMGKLMAAVCQSVLFFAAFTPFLVFAFLLRRIDLPVVGFILGNTFLLSLLLSAVALLLSTMGRVRFVRVVLMAALAGLLSFVVGPSGAAASELLQDPSFLRDPDFLAVYPVLLASGLALLGFSFLSACNLLAHPEENRSTGVRVLSTVSVVAGLGVLTWVLSYGRGRGMDREGVPGMAMVLLFLAAVPGVFFVTERESLGRRVEPRVPRQRGLALLAAPFLPGGGRGVLLLGLQAALVTLWVAVAQATFPHRGGRGFWGDGMAAYPTLLAYLALYLLLPSAVLARFTDDPRLRAVTRAMVPFLLLMFALLPALVGFFVGDRTLAEFEHVGNPFWVVFDLAWDGRRNRGTFLLLAVLSGVAVLINLPRVARGLAEVLRASRRRAGATPPVDAVQGEGDAVAGA